MVYVLGDSDQLKLKISFSQNFHENHSHLSQIITETKSDIDQTFETMFVLNANFWYAQKKNWQIKKSMEQLLYQFIRLGPSLHGMLLKINFLITI